ncbi:DUF5995 family protein [Mangrovibacterium diazotrophicum]|uniref:Uncharacterized protein n=1 Tax=Mangrovibacterium diazotrophicum TaxID=1261403 RepID=A0A419W8T8_9BACT|nr:DUF5995 family protein [Mangrovibacterium diazotrophicum]RKD91888.1 hypothetical protein BC643_2257 [Mangrovibacterium diazotrophicum]
MNTIDEVIRKLDLIIQDAETHNDPAGYFAALYQKVTIKVKEGIANGYFDDGPRMEQLDVLFAQRYLDAWKAYKLCDQMSGSWKKAFEQSPRYWPIVLQHLLVGMNAHINYDLGIVAAEISKGKEMEDLREDFNRINSILSELVHEVQDNLSSVWPMLKYLLKLTGKVDDYLVDFSMKLARDGAWKFAGEYFRVEESGKAAFLLQRDQRISEIVKVVTKPGLIAALILAIVRFTERGSVRDKIQKLKFTPL